MPSQFNLRRLAQRQSLAHGGHIQRNLAGQLLNQFGHIGQNE